MVYFISLMVHGDVSVPSATRRPLQPHVVLPRDGDVCLIHASPPHVGQLSRTFKVPLGVTHMRSPSPTGSVSCGGKRQGSELACALRKLL